jgi:hypothetical protein
LDMGCTLRGDHSRKNREREGNLKLECGWYVHCIEVNIVILSWQRLLWEGEQEAVKRSDRDELKGCNTHMHGNNTRNLSV